MPMIKAPKCHNIWELSLLERRYSILLKIDFYNFADTSFRIHQLHL